VLRRLGGSGTIQEIDEGLQYRAAWARTGLRILGLIENSNRTIPGRVASLWT
jgi:hypothetical protein